MLKVDNIYKFFNTKEKSKNKKICVLSGISFVVNKKEVVGLVGKNGAGKTTLFRIITTLLSPDSGNAYIYDKPIFKDTELTKSNIGVLFGGNSGLYNRLTAYENIEYFGLLNGMSNDDIKKRINFLAKYFNIESYLHRRVANFSRGMKQKIVLMRSIVHDPQLIILDEPTTGLDISGIIQVEEFIKHCKEEGKTVIISSHNLQELEAMVDRVLILDKGTIIFDDTVELIHQNNTNLQQLFQSLVQIEENTNETF